jgi:Putative peptidoglycan binding domain
MDASANRKVVAHRVLSASLAVVAVTGWSLYGYSVSSSGATERELHNQVADIARDHIRIIEERDRLRGRVADLQKAHAELMTAATLPGESDSAEAPAPEDPIGSRLGQAAPTESAEDAASVTGTVLTPSEIEASVRTAQAVLAQLGFGPLASDGVMGAKTRKAIEDFERTNGLVITGELGPSTVEALKRAAQATLQPSVTQAAAAQERKD